MRSRTTVRRSFARFVASLLLLVISGCYGPSKTLPEPRAVVDDGVPDVPAHVASPPAARPTQTKPPQAKPPAKAIAEQPEAPELPPTPIRPPNVADWTLDDLLTADEEGDPLLPAAVAHFLRTAPRDEDTLWLATLMLPHDNEDVQPAEPLAASDAGTSNAIDQPSKPPVVATTASPILEYLAESDRPLAQSTLEEVLRGETRTDLPARAAAEMVLNLWFARGADFYEPLFRQIITRPLEWRSADDADLTPDALQLAIFELIQPTASASTRTWLAEYLVAPETPAAFRERVGPWLAEPKPENLAAHVVLHNSELLSAEAKTKFRGTFATHNASALDVLLGVTPVLRGGKAPPAPATKTAASTGLFVAGAPANLFTAEPRQDDHARAWELSQWFWSDAFAECVAADLSRMSDIGAQRELMLLACNLPKDAVRKQLHRALHRQWVDGVAPFMAANLTFDSTGDPGFLPLVKLMPREAPKLEANSRPATGRSVLTLSPETKAKQAWMAASENFVRAVNARFFTAARSRQTRGTLPIELHRGADIVAEYHLAWPAEAPKELEVKPDTLVVHYVRMEGEERLSRVADQYKRQLDRSTTRTTAKGEWLDSIVQDAGSGRLRSVDVMLSREGPAPRNATTPEPLVIELLWIEISDPG